MEGVDNKLQSLEQAMDTRLARIEDQNHQIMLALQKKKKGTFFVSFTFLFCLVCLIDSLRPINYISVKQGRVFLG